MAPEYGRRLLVRVIDERGRSGYPVPFAYLPRTADPRDGFVEVSYARLKRAVDVCTWHLASKLGKSAHFDTFAWLAHPLDLRYQILTLAAMKLGWRAFFPSPRNGLQAQLSLLDQADCQTWLVDKRIDPTVHEIQKLRPSLRLVAIPDLDELLADHLHVAHYPYEKSFEEARSDPCLLLHTSGSAGVPKIVVCKPTLFTVMDAFHDFSCLSSRLFMWHHFTGMRAFMPFPNFHAAGLITSIGANVWFDVVNVMAPLRPLTADLADTYHQHARLDLSILPPVILKDIASSDDYLEHLSGLKYIGNCGGPSSREVGLALQPHAYPLNIIGITEASTLPTELIDPEDFLYMRYSPCAGAEFRQVSDEFYEMVFKRDSALRDYQNVFNTFPDRDEWASKDLYRKHPTKSDLWMYSGRSDDIIVFDNGEKLNPVTVEQKLSSHPKVNGATMFGTGRFEAGVIIQPSSPLKDIQETANLREEVWQKIMQQTNLETVAHGRISKDMILIAKPDKPFPRSGKGSIQRRLLLDLYAQEIDEVYDAKNIIDRTDAFALSTSDSASLTRRIQDWIQQQTGRAAPTSDEDLFNAGLGFDSLMVMRLSRALNSALGDFAISPRTIYSSPTIQQLVAHILAVKTNEGHSTGTRISREGSMDAMLGKYLGGLPINAPMPSQRPSAQKMTVALTGSTGTLGTYILDVLIRDPNVSQIYCLNRSASSHASALAKQRQLQASRGLQTDLDNVTFLQIDVSEPKLGLQPPQLGRLLQSIDVVIHNSWLVDFNRPLASFEPHIHGARQLIDLCAQSAKRAPLIFISSVSTAQEWQPQSLAAPSPICEREEKPVPETLHGWSASSHMGYAESKHVAERLLAEASARQHLPISICRVGQIAGPVQWGTKGAWPEREWIPSLIRTAVALKSFPRDLGVHDFVDWVPVDLCAQIVAEIARASVTSAATHSGENGGKEAGANKDGTLKICHIANPRITTWSNLLDTIISAAFPANAVVSIVSFTEWVQRLKVRVEAQGAGNGDEDDKLENLPAARLLPFLDAEAAAAAKQPGKRKARLDTANAEAWSETLTAMEMVKGEWLGMWMQRWGLRSGK